MMSDKHRIFKGKEAEVIRLTEIILQKMSSFNLPNNSIPFKPIVIGIVCKQETTILLHFILVENDEIRVAIVGEVDRDEIIKLEARVSSIDICYDKCDGVLIDLYCEVDV